LIAERHGLNKAWLNYAVKMFLVPHDRRVLLDLSHLKVYVPTPDYLLAMKVLSARSETMDARDLRFLIQMLNLTTVDEVLDIVKGYYPHKQVKPRSRILVEEVFSELK